MLFALGSIFCIAQRTNCGKEKGRNGIRVRSLQKTVAFDLNPSGKGTQRNPPGGKPHSGSGIPFSRCGRKELLFSRNRKKGTPGTGLKCCGKSSATSGLQVFVE